MTTRSDKPTAIDQDRMPGENIAPSANSLSPMQRIKEFLRHRQTWGFLVSVAIMAIISLAFFYPDNIEGNDLRQHDMQQGIAIGQEVKAFEEATGEHSRWTNSLFSGMPTFQISPSYPSDSLFSWITKVYGLGLPSPSNLLFMMMVGFMILMMVMKVRWEYGLIGAIAWGFSTYFIILIGAGHIWKFVTLAYIPPTIAGILLAYRGRILAGSAMAAIFAMMQIVSNHVQMSYYFSFVIAGIIIAYLIASICRRRFKRWCKATAALAIAAALAICANLPNLYHTSKYAEETQRAGTELAEGEASGGLSRSYITEYSYGIGETFTLFIPNIKGGATVKPTEGSLALLSLADLDKASDYSDPNLRQIPQYFGEPQMTNGPVYVGAIIFALFIVGCIVVKGPLKWALVVLTILSILLSWGRNFMGLTDLFIDIVPMYSKFRTVESILVIAEFTIPLLAIMGLWTIIRAETYRRWMNIAVAIGFGITGFFCLLGAIVPSVYGADDELSRSIVSDYPSLYRDVIELRLSMISSDCWRSLIFLALASISLVLYMKRRLKAVVAGCCIGFLVLVDLYSVNKRYIDHDSFYHPSVYRQADRSTPIQPTEADMIIMQDDDMNYRVMDIDRFGSADPSYFHKMIGGYHAAKLGRYQDLIERHIGRLETQADMNVLNMLNTRYFIANGQVMGNPDALGNAWFVDKISYVGSAGDEMDALDRIDPAMEAVADKSFESVLGQAQTPAEGDYIEETSYAPNKLTYRTHSEGDRIAVFSEIYFPWGWTATVDGKPAEIGRVNYVLRAMRIPAGDHEIVMTFDPASVSATTTVATIAVLLIYLSVIAAIILPLIRRRKA